jgi:hypothetical protein
MSNKKAKARCLNQSAGRQDVLVLHILRPGSPQIVLD